jgi:4'-phosphopantetheinyl transferase
MAAADVWIVAIPDQPHLVDAALGIVSAEERVRAERFRHAADRRSYLCAHAALRVLLGGERQLPFEARSFASGSHGKPFLPESAARFNLSRSGTRALIGICRDGEIGVDIDRVDRRDAIHDVARSSFSDVERAWIAAAEGEHGRQRRFLRLWVIREALVKATGSGLSRSMADIAISIDGDVPSLAGEDAWELVEPPETVSDHLDGCAAAVVVPRGCIVTWHGASWPELAPPASSPPQGR